MDQQEVMGRICKDKISGVEGLCVGVVDWMFGCRLYLLRLRMDSKEDQAKYGDHEINVPEACLEVVDPVPAIDAGFPAEEEPKFFGKICRDKVTGYVGMCIGRYWTFYAEKQYVLQGKYSRKKLRKPAPVVLDEGRVEVLESKDAIEPQEVKTEYKGGIFNIPKPEYLSLAAGSGWY